MKITEDFTPGELAVSQILDANGQPIAITDSATTPSLPNKIIVIVESTHTGVNRNKVEYTMHGLENSVSSWTDNYEKPILLNHNSYSDNLGRVKHAEYCQSVIDASKYCIKLTLEITNQAAIERFLDGRYKTFSIGGYTDTAKCSICGKDQMADGWCGHRRGRKYDGKECYWTLGVMEYDEISVVNCPADPHAQAIDIKVITSEPAQEDSTTGEDENPGATADMFGKIDGLLGSQDGVGTGEENPTDEPATGDSDGGQSDNNGSDNGESEKEQKDEVEKLQALLAEKDELMTQLKDETDAKIAEVESKVADAEAKLQLVTDEKNALTDQNVEYAKFAHKVLCDKVADMSILIGDKTAEERDGLVAELVTKTTKSLNDMAVEIMNREPQQRDSVRGSVTNPVPITDEDDDTSEEKQTDFDKLEDAFKQFFRSKI